MSLEWGVSGDSAPPPSESALVGAGTAPPDAPPPGSDALVAPAAVGAADTAPTPDAPGTAAGPDHEEPQVASLVEPAPPEASTHGPPEPPSDHGAAPPEEAVAPRIGPPPTGSAAVEPPGEVTAAPAPEVVRSDTFVASATPTPAPSAAPVVVAPAERRRLFRRSSKPRHRKSRRIGRTVVVLAVLLILGGSAVAARATVALPPAVVRQTVPSALQVGGDGAPLSWPTGVQAALAIPSLGVSAASGPETPAPVASLTKMMTAHVVLADHPLAPDQDGPSVTITAADVATEVQDQNTDQANIQVAAGEVLTERQVLEGMLIHSANNFAELLADWDAGSVPAFVAKMNAAARALGMTQTTYSDASGFSTQSVSTAADQAKLASVLIQNPTVAQIVDNTSVTLPIAGTVPSYTPLVGVDDVVGVKSGFTSAAGGCDVLALSDTVDGVPVEVIVAVTGFQGAGNVIGNAGLEALSVARQAVGRLQSVPVVAPGQRVGVARAAGYSVPVVARSGISVLAWPGQQVVERLIVDRLPPAGARAGWRVGSVTAQVGQQELTVPVVTGRTLPTPTFFQRVF